MRLLSYVDDYFKSSSVLLPLLLRVRGRERERERETTDAGVGRLAGWLADCSLFGLATYTSVVG